MSRVRPLTIAIVAACPFPWPRGTPIRTYRIAEALAELGHEVHVITYHLGERFEYPFTVHRIDDVAGYQKTSAGPSFRKMTQLNPALVKLSRDVSARIAFDVVHAIHMEGLLVASRAMPHLPIVYDAHTSLGGELPDHLQYLPHRLVSFTGALLDQVIPARADYTIAVSDSLREKLVEGNAVSDATIEVIANGVEYEIFQPAGGASVDAEQIIFTGNDARYQNLELLLEAFALLQTLRPEARLKIVGSSTFELEKAFVEGRGLGGCVDIHTTTFAQELEHLATASIAVSPRTLCDGVPQKLFNYMAAGKAIVACEGSAVHIRHGETGLRVANDDAEAMATALLELIDDSQRARALGDAAREEVRAQHSWRSVACKVQDVYLRTIEDKAPGNYSTRSSSITSP